MNISDLFEEFLFVVLSVQYLGSNRKPAYPKRSAIFAPVFGTLLRPSTASLSL